MSGHRTAIQRIRLSEDEHAGTEQFTETEAAAEEAATSSEAAPAPGQFTETEAAAEEAATSSEEVPHPGQFTETEAAAEAAAEQDAAAQHPSSEHMSHGPSREHKPYHAAHPAPDESDHELHMLEELQLQLEEIELDLLKQEVSGGQQSHAGSEPSPEDAHHAGGHQGVEHQAHTVTHHAIDQQSEAQHLGQPHEQAAELPHTAVPADAPWVGQFTATEAAAERQHHDANPHVGQFTATELAAERAAAQRDGETSSAT